MKKITKIFYTCEGCNSEHEFNNYAWKCLICNKNEICLECWKVCFNCGIGVCKQCFNEDLDQCIKHKG